MSRQNYYRATKRRSRAEVDARLIEQLVASIRSKHPRIGGRKLLHMIGPELSSAGVEIGRDRFFKVLSSSGLLVPPLPRAPRTTQSRHGDPVYPNRAKSLELSGSNQLWVSDITYIRTREDFVYLSLVTDAWSRKIVGAYTGVDLCAVHCIKALKQAVRQLHPGANPMHHSDRGSQYCSGAYTKVLGKHDIKISMTEENHCAENALAERINGILKQEYGLGGTFVDLRQAAKAVRQAVSAYNEERPHMALAKRTPSEVHREGMVG